MSLLTPIFLLLGLLAAPIIVLYMLRLRRREVVVSSTMLWQKLVRDREANAPWQRLRPNLLLLLQLLILAALVLALARPFIPAASVVSGSVVVLLDGSASMHATDVSPSRFAAAQEEVRRMIDDLGGDDRMTLILVGRTPRVLVSASADRDQLGAAVASAAPENGPVDWPAAMALAGGAAQGFRDARIVVVSDGGLTEALPPLPVEAVYVPVGERNANLALAALATRSGVGGEELFASIVNTGSAAQQALLSLEMDGTLLDSRRVEVPAGETRNFALPLAPGAATISARLSEQTEDFLPLDDQAWAVPAGGGSSRTLLVSEGNLFLEQALAVLPGIQLFTAGPDADVAESDYDLYVFDGVPVPALPPGDTLIINPQPAEGDLYTVTGIFTDTAVTRLAESPLLQYVNWRNVNIREAQEVSAPWARPLVEAGGGPLLFAGEEAGRRAVIIPFALQASDLPLQIAFPILMANITNWLSPGRAFDAPAGIQPGDALQITPGATATAVLVEKPDGRTWTEPVAAESIIFGETEQPGLYHVTLRDPSGDRPGGSFAVNLFSPAESEIQPAPALRLGQTTVTAPATAEQGQRELWPWLAALAVLVLVIEWWVHFRGLQLPQLRRN